MSAVYVVVPDGIDDPQWPSGGNVYDRHLCRGLADLAWSVRERPVPGAWPRPATADLAALVDIVASIPDGAIALVDGLVALAAPEVLVPETGRLRLVVLVHMPFGAGAVLSHAVAVVTTSEWARNRLVEQYSLLPDRVHVAEPGVEPAEPAPGTTTGGALLCVAAVAPHKGHDVLLAALTEIAHLPWRCTCVGSLDRDPAYADDLRERAARNGVGGRIRFTGPLTGQRLDTAYAGADVLVLPSRGETYGMVVTEALARGLPVIATAVGGIPQTIGGDDPATTPGLLVPPEDPPALAGALAGWLGDDGLRRQLRDAAGRRRSVLDDWSVTAHRVSGVLEALC